MRRCYLRDFRFRLRTLTWDFRFCTGTTYAKFNTTKSFVITRAVAHYVYFCDWPTHFRVIGDFLKKTSKKWRVNFFNLEFSKVNNREHFANPFFLTQNNLIFQKKWVSQLFRAILPLFWPKTLKKPHFSPKNGQNGLKNRKNAIFYFISPISQTVNQLRHFNTQKIRSDWIWANFKTEHPTLNF